MNFINTKGEYIYDVFMVHKDKYYFMQRKVVGDELLGIIEVSCHVDN